jgi:hypothetical protein
VTETDDAIYHQNKRQKKKDKRKKHTAIDRHTGHLVAKKSEHGASSQHVANSLCSGEAPGFANRKKAVHRISHGES